MPPPPPHRPCGEGLWQGPLQLPRTSTGADPQPLCLVLPLSPFSSTRHGGQWAHQGRLGEKQGGIRGALAMQITQG